MPNNVYIGSRYVPIFDGAWNNTKSYEPLTIVEYGNNSYTSKKPVPVGTLPTDTSYWALTGNYNGQISNLQQQINVNASNITALANRMNRKFLFVGDSYGDNPRVATTWGAKVAAALHLSASQWDNICSSGAKWYNTSNTYLTQIQNYSGDKSSITDIVVCAGANDVGTSKANIVNAMTAFASYAATNYPNAKIWCGWIGFGIPFMGTNNAYIAYEAFKQCGCAGMAYMKNLLAANHVYADLEDSSFHPNANALTKIGWAIATCLQGGFYDCCQYDNNAYPAQSSNIITPYVGSLTIIDGQHFHFADDKAIFELTRVLCSFGSGQTFTNDQNTPIAYLQDASFRPKDTSFCTPGTLEVTSDGTNWSALSGYFTALYDTNSAKTILYFRSNTGTATNITYALINLNLSVPMISC